MKRIFVIWVLSLIFIEVTQAQNTERLVEMIRQQYNEVVSIESNGRQSGCQNRSKVMRREVNGSLMSFKQSATKCTLSGMYSTITCSFNDWELNANTKYYFKNGELFFAFTTYADVAFITEYRIYYSGGRVIKVLKKSLEGPDVGSGGQTRNLEVRSGQEYDWAVSFHKKRLSESYGILRN